MLTRGKVHNVSDGTQDHEAIADEDGMNDDNSSEKGSSSSKDRRSEDSNIRPEQTLKMKQTPSADGTATSPILVSSAYYETMTIICIYLFL